MVVRFALGIPLLAVVLVVTASKDQCCYDLSHTCWNNVNTYCKELTNVALPYPKNTTLSGKSCADWADRDGQGSGHSDCRLTKSYRSIVLLRVPYCYLEDGSHEACYMPMETCEDTTGDTLTPYDIPAHCLTLGGDAWNSENTNCYDRKEVYQLSSTKSGYECSPWLNELHWLTVEEKSYALNDAAASEGNCRAFSTASSVPYCYTTSAKMLKEDCMLTATQCGVDSDITYCPWPQVQNSVPERVDGTNRLPITADTQMFVDCDEFYQPKVGYNTGCQADGSWTDSIPIGCTCMDLVDDCQSVIDTHGQSVVCTSSGERYKVGSDLCAKTCGLCT